MKVSFKRTAGIFVLASTAILGLATVPAEAATAACRLYISNNPGDYYNLVTNTCVPRQSTDRLVQSIYYGADWPDLDDWMFDRSYPYAFDRFYATDRNLNEDTRSGDEIYSLNRFYTANGGYYEIKSNEVHSDWNVF